jgi:hypothetical protein
MSCFTERQSAAMRLRKPPRPLTPEEQREENIRRNRERIFNPPRPTLRDHAAGFFWAIEEWWCRHVTQRELYRLLDNARVFAEENPGFLGVMRAEALRNGKVPPDPADMLRRLGEDWNSHPGYYPWGDDDRK